MFFNQKCMAHNVWNYINSWIQKNNQKNLKNLFSKTIQAGIEGRKNNSVFISHL